MKVKINWLRSSFWAGLILICGAPRFLAAFLLANPDGDEYSYVTQVEMMRANLAAGTFTLKGFFGFWLPMYQFISAVVCLVIDHPAYVSKAVAAVFGVGICLLVYRLTLKLTGRRAFAILAFLLIALNPLHILYSAYTVTDVPHAFFVLASLYFAAEKRWILAASFAAAAMSFRLESWMLIGLLPMLQLFVERKVSPVMLVILIIVPLLWLYICWDTTGNALEYFDSRNRYIVWLIAGFPALKNPSLQRIETDIGRLIYAANPAVIMGCFAGAWFVGRELIRAKFARVSENIFAVLAALAYFFALLGFLLLAYFTRNQTDIWDRYGLINFALGVPVLAWTFAAIEDRKPYLARMLAIPALILCLNDLQCQIGDIPDYIQQGKPQQIIANKLWARFEENPNMRFFCDDAGVRVLSGVPKEKFLVSSDSPLDKEMFLTYLKENGVQYLVCADDEESTPAKLFPEMRSGGVNEHFRLSAPEITKDWHGQVWLYRFGQPPAKSG